MVCYKQSSTPTQSFRESKLRFSRLLLMLHDDQIETIVHPGICYIKTRHNTTLNWFCCWALVYFIFSIYLFFLEKKYIPRQKIAPALIS